jgi:hypothetical protein
MGTEQRAYRLKGTFWRVWGLAAALVLLAYTLVAPLRPLFLAEGGPVEDATATTFLLAFLIGTAAYLTTDEACSVPRTATVIPALGLLGFLDETSVMGLLSGSPEGGRAAQGDMPPGAYTLELPGGYVIDGLHDFFTLPFKLWRDHFGLWGYIIGCVLVGVIIGLAVAKRRTYMPWIMAWVRRYPPFDCLRYAVILVFVAMVLDVDIIPLKVARLMEELLELGGGLALAAAAIGLHLQFPSPESPRSDSRS